MQPFLHKLEALRVKSLNIPNSKDDSKLKKTLLLRNLRSEITETALQVLEEIKAIDPNDAVSFFDSTSRAYCAVAVECTVKYLSATSDGIASKAELRKKNYMEKGLASRVLDLVPEAVAEGSTKGCGGEWWRRGEGTVENRAVGSVDGTQELAKGEKGSLPPHSLDPTIFNAFGRGSLTNARSSRKLESRIS
ncbi:hypothetical protein HN873_010310 [Arachis hypogaea]